MTIFLGSINWSGSVQVCVCVCVCVCTREQLNMCITYIKHTVVSVIHEDAARPCLTDVLHTNTLNQTTNRRLPALSPCLWQLFHLLINTSTLIVDLPFSSLLPPPFLSDSTYCVIYTFLCLSVSLHVFDLPITSTEASSGRVKVSRLPKAQSENDTANFWGGKKPTLYRDRYSVVEICDYISHVHVMRYVNAIFTRCSTAH